jgi:sec-independent protein translocase protein TatB
MFDIGFWEIALIAVVALLVVGPDEFPSLVRNIGAWIGKIRHFMTETKNDLDREFLKAEELKQMIERETSLAALHEQVDARKIVAGDNATASTPAEVSAGSADPLLESTTVTDGGHTPSSRIEKSHGSSE